MQELKQIRKSTNNEGAFHKTQIQFSHKEWIAIKAVARLEERSVAGLVRNSVRGYLKGKVPEISLSEGGGE